jgi:hypothetical protein
MNRIYRKSGTCLACQLNILLECMNTRPQPSSPRDQKYELSSYTAAFDEHRAALGPGRLAPRAPGDISDDDLKQLVTDVAMKSGHAARLRTALPSAVQVPSECRPPPPLSTAAAAVAAFAVAAASPLPRRSK